jgi:isohexenylglutaconyl-CoA hydratase
VLDDVLRLEPEAVAAVKRLVQSCATSDDRAVLDAAGRKPGRPAARPQAAEGIGISWPRRCRRGRKE